MSTAQLAEQHDELNDVMQMIGNSTHGRAALQPQINNETLANHKQRKGTAHE